MRTGPLPTVAPDEPPEATIDEPPQRHTARTPADRRRLAVAVVGLGGALLLAASNRSATGIEEDILDLFRHLPASVAALLVGVVQVGAASAPLVNVVTLTLRRQLRLLIQVVAAAAVAATTLALIDAVLDRPPIGRSSDVLGPNYLTGSDFPSGPYLAALTSMLTVMAPWMSRRGRRVAAVGLVVLALARVASTTAAAWSVLLALAVGIFAGTLLLAAVGSPNRRPHGPEVLAGLTRAGIRVRSLHAVAQRGRRVTAYRAETFDGRSLRVELASPDDHGARLWVRLWRWIRLTDPGLQHPLTSLQRLVEHEALVSMLATNAGVRTPRLVAVGQAGQGGQLLTFVEIEAVPLANVPVELITDGVLRAAWGQLEALGRARVAHRNLALDHLLLDAAGHVWVADFSSAEPAPDDRLLAGDVAQLLCAAALVVGPRRSARTAVEVLGREAVAAALPRLQPLALAGATRRSYRQRSALLGELREAVQEATGVSEVSFEDLARLKPRSVLGLVMVALAVYVLLPQLGNLDDVTTAVGKADPWWFALALAASAVTYLGAAMGIIGSVPDRVRLLPTLGAQVASSFVNKVTPANVGGIALNARFLQKHGVETSVAFTAVGLSAVAGLVVHVSFLVVVAVWVGRSGDAQFSLPFGRTVVLIGLAVLAAGALALLVPAGRRLAMDRLLPPVRRSGSALREIAMRPAKLSALLGGSALVTIGYLVALACCLQAFGGGPPLASVALVFLAGTALATAAPTPGGLGAVEAALVAGLTGIGVSTEIAVSAVLSYRLLTFWLPVVPGWLAFVVLQRRMEL